jgi:aminomuconate-semialdehyde/2-hydroxymuconate-6-semialdehyde dehydrogenase
MNPDLARGTRPAAAPAPATPGHGHRPVPELRNFIGGEFRAARQGRTLEDLNPATGQVITRFPDSDPADVADAVAAAKSAFPGFAALPVAERSALLMEVARRIEANADGLAELEAMDVGKPVALARRLDIPRAIANFRFFAGAILHTTSECHPMEGALNYTLRRPLGVVGLISPWNLPLYLLTWKIAPALAAGNTAVAKPSELSPLTANALAEIIRDAGVPPGVLNIVHGLGARAGEALTTHPDVRAISFTGGTATGAAIARSAGPLMKKLSLELGGKNPNLIFADADFGAAVDSAVRSSFLNQGEICLCGSRILVERPLYDRFLAELTRRAATLAIGDPLDPATEFGSLVSADHQRKVEGYLALAGEEGGVIHSGGRRPSGLPAALVGGFFLEPTILTGLRPECRVMQEEIFGPVVTVTPFERESDAIAIANGTPYGLSASVWTRDLGRAHRVGAALDAGTVWVNTWLLRDLRVPFGGMKQSGIGREGGHDSLDFFTESKNICIKLD